MRVDEEEERISLTIAVIYLSIYYAPQQCRSIRLSKLITKVAKMCPHTLLLRAQS